MCIRDRMGILLGITLGVIGFFRGASTSEDLRSAKKEMEAPIQVVVPVGEPLTTDADGAFQVPEGTPIAIREPAKRKTHVHPPSDQPPEQTVSDRDLIYTFPAGTETHTETVGRWRFGVVIAISVAFICLWGSLIGSMLPLMFNKLGFDPALASSPFVATFVDVTGILAYFTIATILLF